MKSKKEVSEAMEKQISEFGDIAKQLNKRMQPMILRMQKTAESAAIKYGMLESDFDEFMSQYKRYFWKRGFITPKDFDDFFSWLCGCRWAESNEPFGAMEIKESDFTLYHEYKELKLNPSGWNDHQERERLEDRFNPQTPQQTEKPKLEQTEVLSMQITHPKRTEIAKAIKDKYSSYKGKDFKILYEALLELCLFPKKGKRSVFFRCLQNEGYNINNFQMLEDKHFQRGQTLKTTGKYFFTEDEKRRDEIIEYLKTIIETK